VLNLVNKITKLESGIFVKVIKTETVKSGFRNLSIFGHDTYILRGIFNRASGNNKRDLVLNNVAIVEGFYINIVFEAKLL
jgi:hypothetical protein